MGVGGIIMVYFLIENDCVRGGRQTRGKNSGFMGEYGGRG